MSKEQKEPRKVLFATPSMDGRVDGRFSISLGWSMLLCAQNEIALFPLQRNYDSTLLRARNDLFRDMLEGGFNDIILMDSDQEWDPKWIIELLKYPVDFVGAPVCKKSDEVIDFNVKATDPVIDMETGLVEVDSIGTGMLRMSRKAVQDIWDVSQPYKNGPSSSRAMCFPFINDEGELVSEDNVLSIKWKSLGNPVYVAPHMDVIHVGVKTWRRSFREVLRTRMEAIHGKKKPDVAWDSIHAGA